LVSRVISPTGTYVQSFRSIDPAVRKRALLTDDGQHVIARAHTWAKIKLQEKTRNGAMGVRVREQPPVWEKSLKLTMKIRYTEKNILN
jgi:hypothetical protein